MNIAGYISQKSTLMLLGVVSLTLSFFFSPSQALTFLSSSPPPTPRLQVSAWMPTSWDGESARASFRRHVRQLTTVSPYWYGVRADGQLSPLTGARDPLLLAEARAAGARVIPTISNSYNGTRIHTILNDDALAAAHLQAIIEEVERYGYDGIDLDYENLYAEDKDRYAAWVKELAAQLHARNKRLTVTVQPKTFHADGWDGPGAHDYRALANAADELRVMIYGWCWKTGCVGSAPPGPIAPIHWMQRVIDYAKTQAPADKIVIGLHLYGYDWQIGATSLNANQAQLQEACFSPPEPVAFEDVTGRALVWAEADALLKSNNATLQWWEEDDQGLVQEPWFSYDNGQHVVAFANADSVEARVQLVEQAGLRGVIFWRLGGEDPALWDRLPHRSYATYLPTLLLPAPSQP